MADKTIKFLLLGEDRTASRTLKGVGTQADNAGRKLGGLSGKLRTALTAGAILAAGKAVADFGADSVSAFRDADKSQRQLEDAYKRFPKVQDVSIAKMREMNQAIQDKTGADADDLAASQAVLARYKLTGTQLQEMTPLLDDYAARTGKSLPDAAKTLGKAMMGNGKAMKELGIGFKDTGDPAKNFEQIMAGLQDKVGGFAEKEAGTLDGKLKMLDTKFGDVQEAIGEQLIPVLTDLAEVGMDVVDFISENISWLRPLAAAVGVVVAGVLAWSAAQWLLNAALLANPVGLIVIAIAALVAGLVVAYNSSKEFRDVVDAAFKAIGAAANWLWNNAIAPAVRGIVNGFAWVVDGIANMLDALGNIPGFGWAKTAAANMKGAAAQARDLANNIKDIKSKHVNVTATIRAAGTARWVVGGRGGNTFSMRPEADGGVVSYYAAGGMRESHVAQIGRVGETRIWNEPETQGEAYIPLASSKRSRSLAIWRETGKRLGVLGFSNGAVMGGSADSAGNVHITVQGDSDPDAAARRIAEKLRAWQRRTGRPVTV